MPKHMMMMQNVSPKPTANAMSYKSVGAKNTNQLQSMYIMNHGGLYLPVPVCVQVW